MHVFTVEYDRQIQEEIGERGPEQADNSTLTDQLVSGSAGHHRVY